jgi:hypothetical protein
LLVVAVYCRQHQMNALAVVVVVQVKLAARQPFAVTDFQTLVMGAMVFQAVLTAARLHTLVVVAVALDLALLLALAVLAVAVTALVVELTQLEQVQMDLAAAAAAQAFPLRRLAQAALAAMAS